MNGFVLSLLIYLVVGVLYAMKTIKEFRLLGFKTLEENRLRKEYLESNEIDALRDLQKTQQERSVEVQLIIDNMSEIEMQLNNPYNLAKEFLGIMLLWFVYVIKGFVRSFQKGGKARVEFERGLERGKEMKRRMKD
jgi:hypothetical protein